MGSIVLIHFSKVPLSSVFKEHLYTEIAHKGLSTLGGNAVSKGISYLLVCQTASESDTHAINVVK